jgi:hypothetical protein
MTTDVRRAIAISIIVQGLGSLAPFITVIGLARIAGPDVQGTFAVFKTWSDLVSTLVVFGFPQAFVYMINKKISSREELLNGVIFYVAIAAPLVFPVSILSIHYGYIDPPPGQSIIFFGIAMSVGMGALFLQRLVRGVYLTVDHGFLFSLITSAPSFFLMVTILAAATVSPFYYDVAFLVAGLLTVVATIPWVVRIIRESPGYRFRLPLIPVRPLAEQAGYVFLQALAVALQPVITIIVLQRWGADLTTIGFFSASTIIIVGVNILFGLVAPILFNRWSATMESALMGRLQGYALKASLVLLVGGVILVPVVPFFVGILFGADYLEAAWAFQVMILSLGPVAYTRILYPAIHAAGFPARNSISCGIRLLAAVGVQIAMTFYGMSPLAAAVWAWVIAEWIAAIYSYLSLPYRQSKPSSATR